MDQYCGLTLYIVVSVGLFGMAQLLHVHSAVYFAIMWGLAGLFQSTGWPGNITVMVNQQILILGLTFPRAIGSTKVLEGEFLAFGAQTLPLEI